MKPDGDEYLDSEETEVREHEPMVAFGRTFLDKCPCVDCGMTPEQGHPMYIESNCHPGAGLIAIYEDGIMALACRMCGKMVIPVLVGTETATMEVKD